MAALCFFRPRAVKIPCPAGFARFGQNVISITVRWTRKERKIMDQLGESIRKLILAGIGAAAVTREKGESVLRDLVKKGELTVEQGKVLNEELKRNVKEAIRDNVTVHVVTPSDDLMSAVDDMDEESLAALKERIRAAEEARKAAPAAEKADEAEKPCRCGQAGNAEKAPAEKCASEEKTDEENK